MVTIAIEVVLLVSTFCVVENRRVTCQFFSFFFLFFCWLLSNYWQRTFYLNFEVSLLNNNGKTKKSDVTFFIGSFLFFFLPLCIWFKMDAHDNDEKVKPKNWKISSSSSIKNSEQKKKCQYFFALKKLEHIWTRLEI